MQTKWLTREMQQKLNLSKGFKLLGNNSAKVVHSLQNQGWNNIILYLSPADRSLFSFVAIYDDVRLADGTPVLDAFRRALLKAPAPWGPWKPRANWDQRLAEARRQLAKMRATPFKAGIDFPTVDLNNKFTPLTLCPHASPACRRVCLNTSGKSKMAASKKWLKALMAQHPGITSSDVAFFAWIKGESSIYGGASSLVQAARLKRTHLMWLTWAITGSVTRNPFNDILFREAMTMSKKERVKYAGQWYDVKGSALRLNGTSDMPVHTLETTDGKNLMTRLGKERGIVCYDYTKDHTKAFRWIRERSWKGWQPVLRKKATLGRGKEFPSNYYVTLSWSELNSAQCFRFLKEGGNIVMVFSQSQGKPVRGEKKLPKTSSAKSRSARGVALPTGVPIGDMSGDPDLKGWAASVVDADDHDLRFMDPLMGPFRGGQGGGVVAALTIKATADGQNFTEKAEKNLFRRFTLPGMVNADGLFEVRRNPSQQEGAVASVDLDVLRMSSFRVGNHIITTTGMGT